MQYDMWICEPCECWVGQMPQQPRLDFPRLLSHPKNMRFCWRPCRCGPWCLRKTWVLEAGFASEYEQTAGTDGDDCYRERHLTMSLYGSDSAYRTKRWLDLFKTIVIEIISFVCRIMMIIHFFCAKVTLYKPIWLMSAWIVCIRISHPLLNETHNDGSIGLGTRNFYHFRPRSGNIGVPCSSFPSQRRTPSVSQLANGPLLHSCGLLYLI